MNQLYEIYWVKFIKEESKEKEKNHEPLTQDDFTRRLCLVLKPGTIVTISKITTVERQGRGEYKIQDWRAANLLAPSYVRLTKQENNVKESRLISLQGRLNQKDSLAIDQMIKDQNIFIESLNEDYSSYIGRPLKDFLDSISDKDSVILDHNEPAHGVGGFNGRVNQIPWYVADRIIRDIQLGDGDHYKFKIITEAFGDERKQNKRYKVVVADENSRPLKVKDVSGVGKVNKELEKLTNDVLADMKATQVYVTNEDNKEIYVKFVNDDGSWDIIQNDIDLENEVEDRDTLFNHIMADLSSESSYFVGDLRNMSRKGEGYVGFDDQEIGFNNDTFYLTSVNDKQINWAKKVADYYGLQTSAVKENNGRKYIEIYAPGISDDPKLIP